MKLINNIVGLFVAMEVANIVACDLIYNGYIKTDRIKAFVFFPIRYLKYNGKEIK